MSSNLSTELLAQSMAYAENNFLNDSAKHLHVDKEFIRNNFDLNGKRVLDFGCGMGGMSLWYAKNWKCKVYGVDIDGQHIAIADALKAKHNIKNVTFEKRDIVNQPLPPQLEGSFDVIFMNDVAEHIPYDVLEKIFAEFKRLLNPKGRIFVSYPPWHSPYASHVTRVTRLPWCQFLPQPILLKWIEKKNIKISGEHESDLLEAYKGLNHLTHKRLTKIVHKIGFKVNNRLCHSFLRKLALFRNFSIENFIFKYLVSKEIVVLQY